MKILVVSDVLGEENNGTTIACMNLIRYLKRQGDDVRVLCPDQDKKELPGYFIVPNLNLGFIINAILKKNQVSLSRPKKDIILKALDGVDHVHIMLPFPLGIKTLKLARAKGIPVTAGFHCQAENFTAHIGLMNNTFANNRFYKSIYKKFYQYVDAIHYPTQFICDTFEKAVKRKTNAYVISNGVNYLYRKQEVTRKGQYSKHFNILFIGRISREKSHYLLLKAVAKSKHKDNIQLIFAGQGPREDEVRSLAKQLKIRRPIMKFFSRKDLVNVINSADLYVHPAEIEIEAISCLEAITCGLVPVINDSPRSATRYFALTDDNKFKFNDVDDLAKKIDYWYENPEAKKKCSESYLDFTTKFEQDNCMNDMREMIKTFALNEESHTPLLKYYYKDERNDDFANDGVEKIHNNPGYKYVHKSWVFKTIAFLLYYVVGKPLVWFINKVFYSQKIINKKVLKPYRKSGYFIYANHTELAADAFTPNLLTAKRNYIIVSEETTSIKGLRTLVKMFGAIAVPSNLVNAKEFKKAIEYRVGHDHASVTIYPEAHIWPKCTFIRDFTDVSFKYPVEQNVPSFVITNTHQKRRHGKKTRLISYVSGPFFPDNNLDIKDAAKKLRDEVYNSMINDSSKVSQLETIRYINLGNK